MAEETPKRRATQSELADLLGSDFVAEHGLLEEDTAPSGAATPGAQPKAATPAPAKPAAAAAPAAQTFAQPAAPASPGAAPLAVPRATAPLPAVPTGTGPIPIVPANTGSFPAVPSTPAVGAPTPGSVAPVPGSTGANPGPIPTTRRAKARQAPGPGATGEVPAALGSEVSEPTAPGGPVEFGGPEPAADPASEAEPAPARADTRTMDGPAAAPATAEEDDAGSEEGGPGPEDRFEPDAETTLEEPAPPGAGFPKGKLRDAATAVGAWLRAAPLGTKIGAAAGAATGVFAVLVLPWLLALSGGAGTAYLAWNEPLRVGPGEDGAYPMIATLERDERLEVIEEAAGTGFVLVRAPLGQVGFVRRSSLVDEIRPTTSDQPFTLCRRRPDDPEGASCLERAAKQHTDCTADCAAKSDDSTCTAICDQRRDACAESCKSKPTLSAMELTAVSAVRALPPVQEAPAAEPAAPDESPGDEAEPAEPQQADEAALEEPAEPEPEEALGKGRRKGKGKKKGKKGRRKRKK